MDAGFPAVTKMDVYGRGKQRGMKIGEVTYDELPKEMIFTVVKESEKDDVIKVIMQSARSGVKGAYGDGKIFVSSVDEVYTVSSGRKDIEEAVAAPAACRRHSRRSRSGTSVSSQLSAHGVCRIR